MDKALGYLGLMRKANAVAIGETDTGAAAKSGKAVLICLAADASDNARKRAETFAHARSVPVTSLVSAPKAELIRLSRLFMVEASNTSPASVTVPSSLTTVTC